MRYQNAAELLPAELLEALQGYLDGGYLYIPRRAEHRRAWGERTRRPRVRIRWMLFRARK